jgi:hypothetical protein
MSDKSHFVSFNAVLLVIISTNLFIFPLLAATAINTFSLARAGEHQWPEQSLEWGIVPQFAFNVESPQHDEIVGTIKSAKFNFRFDYQLDSDIVAAYFGLAPSTLEDSVHRQTGLFKPYLPYEQRHVPVEAAWVAKNCQSSNHREQFVEAVMGAGVRVDSFGGCMHNKDFPAEYQDISRDDESFAKLLSQYKFYLSFENSICRHYYTEKLFRSLEIGVIPILLGHPADSEYLLPHKVCELMKLFCVCRLWGWDYQLCICEQFSSYINHQPTAVSPLLCAGCSHQGVGFPER